MSLVDDLLNKKLTRKQFIASFGLAAMSLMGISSLIGILSDKSSEELSQGSYGSQYFGVAEAEVKNAIKQAND